jgi:hypothetical protein
MDNPETPKPSSKGNPVLLLAILVVATTAIFLFFGSMGCIVEGTLIDTPEGLVPIEHLRSGDRVWTEASSGTVEAGRVVAVHQTRARSYLELHLRDGSVLRATALHPIATPGGWREAGLLRVGDPVKGRNGWQSIAEIRERKDSVRVYDLEVSPNANFYAAGVLVHNKTSVRASNERNASAALKTVATAEADFRSYDRDGNKMEDYWVADVSGLYRIMADNQPQMLIEPSIAMADAAPLTGPTGRLSLAPLTPGGPKAGYRYRTIPLDAQGKPYAEDVDGDGMKLKSKRGFAFCAFPDRHGRDGWQTFIVNEEGPMWKKDTGGKPVDRWPANPPGEGWSKLD